MHAFNVPMKLTHAIVLACLAIGHAPAVFADTFQISERTLSWHAPKDDSEHPWYMASWEKGTIVMPFVVSARTEVATRINDTLYMDLVGIPAPMGPGKTFTLPASTQPTDSESALDGTNSIAFQTLRNDDRVLSLSIEREGCGAYCEEYTTPYNFDAETGRDFEANDVFTPAGRTRIARLMAQERKKQYSAMLKTLNAQLAKQGKKSLAHPSSEEVEDLKARIELNEGCLAGLSPDSGTTPDPGETFRYLRFAIPDATIVQFTAERCSNHASRALDDVGDVSLSLSGDKLDGMLTAYGRYLLRGGERPKEASSPFGIFLHGKIGQSPMSMRIAPSTDGHSLSAVYYYDKYRLPMELTGTMDGHRIVLTTAKTGGDADPSTAETFELNLQGTTFTGQWRKQDTQRPVSFGL